jgi:hypothetical protein
MLTFQQAYLFGVNSLLIKRNLPYIKLAYSNFS